MSLFRYVSMYFSALVFLIVLDSIWIGFLMTDMYKSTIAKILSISKDAVTLNPLPGILVWMLIVFGALFFVLPLTKNLDYLTTFYYGALFGLVLYGLYDFTNMAIFNNWSVKTAVIDIFWGMFLNGALAVFLRFIQRFF